MRHLSLIYARYNFFSSVDETVSYNRKAAAAADRRVVVVVVILGHFHDGYVFYVRIERALNARLLCAFCEDGRIRDARVSDGFL